MVLQRLQAYHHFEGWRAKVEVRLERLSSRATPEALAARWSYPAGSVRPHGGQGLDHRRSAGGSIGATFSSGAEPPKSKLKSRNLTLRHPLDGKGRANVSCLAASSPSSGARDPVEHRRRRARSRLGRWHHPRYRRRSISHRAAGRSSGLNTGSVDQQLATGLLDSSANKLTLGLDRWSANEAIHLSPSAPRAAAAARPQLVVSRAQPPSVSFSTVPPLPPFIACPDPARRHHMRLLDLAETETSSTGRGSSPP